MGSDPLRLPPELRREGSRVWAAYGVLAAYARCPVQTPARETAVIATAVRLIRRGTP